MTVKHVIGTAITTIMTTALNSLADGSESSASTEVDNRTNLDLVADFEFVMASIGTGSRDGDILLYATYEVDGTNYSDDRHLIGIFKTNDAGNGARRCIIKDVPLRPHPTTYYIQNECGLQLASSGNTLKIITSNVQDV